GNFSSTFASQLCYITLVFGALVVFYWQWLLLEPTLDQSLGTNITLIALEPSLMVQAYLEKSVAHDNKSREEVIEELRYLSLLYKLPERWDLWHRQVLSIGMFAEDLSNVRKVRLQVFQCIVPKNVSNVLTFRILPSAKLWAFHRDPPSLCILCP